MNIDDLKGGYQSLSYEKVNSDADDFRKKIENTIDKVRNEDRKMKLRMIAAVILVAAFGLIYGFRGLLKYIDNPERTQYLGYVLYVLAMFSMLPFIYRKFQRFRQVDYDLPVIRFIEIAEKRYSLFHRDQLSLVPFLVIVDFSLVYMMAEGSTPTIRTIILSQIILIVAVTAGLLVALVLLNKKLYILEELRRIRKSLE